MLDASAVLAFLFREPGAARVAEVLESSCLSSVNLSEVLARFARDAHDPYEVAARLRASSLEVVAFTESEAVVAASLVPATLPLGLSLGDRACLALALIRGVPALTADGCWADLDVGVDIEVIR